MFSLAELDRIPAAVAARLISSAPSACGFQPRPTNGDMVFAFFLDHTGQVVDATSWSWIDRDRMPKSLTFAIDDHPDTEIVVAVLIYTGDLARVYDVYNDDLANLEAAAPVWAVAFHTTGYTDHDFVTSIPDRSIHPVDDHRLSPTPIFADKPDITMYSVRPMPTIPDGFTADPDAVLAEFAALTTPTGNPAGYPAIDDPLLASRLFYAMTESIPLGHQVMGLLLDPQRKLIGTSQLIHLAGYLRGHARAEFLALAATVELSQGDNWHAAKLGAGHAKNAVRQTRQAAPNLLTGLLSALDDYRTASSYDDVADLRAALHEVSEPVTHELAI